MEILCIDMILNALLVTEKYKTQNPTMVPIFCREKSLTILALNLVPLFMTSKKSNDVA